MVAPAAPGLLEPFELLMPFVEDFTVLVGPMIGLGTIFAQT